MKNYLLKRLENLFMLFILLFCFYGRAQDTYLFDRVLAESEYLAVKEINIEPGKECVLQNQAAHFYYSFSEGKITIKYKTGGSKDIDLKLGKVGVKDLEIPYIIENKGSTPVRIMIIELKEHPYIDSKMRD